MPDGESLQHEDTEHDIRTGSSTKSPVLPALSIALAVVCVALVFWSVRLHRERTALSAKLAETQSEQAEALLERPQPTPHSEPPAPPPRQILEINFDDPKQLEDWQRRRGGWQVSDGRLVCSASGAEWAKLVLLKIIGGNFSLRFEVLLPERDRPGNWGCTFYGSRSGDFCMLTFDGDYSRVRLSSVSEGKRTVLCERPMPAELFERKRLLVGLECTDGLITVRADQKMLFAGWHDQTTQGEFAFLAGEGSAFDDLVIESEALADSLDREIEQFAAEFCEQWQLEKEVAIPAAAWEKARGEGEVKVADGVLTVPGSGKTLRLLGDTDWDTYAVEFDIRTANYGSIMLGGSDDESGYVLEFPVPRYETFHMHHMVRGQAEIEALALDQSLRLAPGEWHRVRVLVNPNRHRVYLDGRLVYDFMPMEFPVGKFGVYAWEGISADYGNLRIHLPEGEAEKLRKALEGEPQNGNRQEED